MTADPNLWSTTASANDVIDPDIDWREGQLPGTVNGSARAVMAGVAVLRDDLRGALRHVRLAKTANYTVANGDKGKTIACSGGSFTLTVPVASGFDANYAIQIDNENTIRAIRVVPSGHSNFTAFFVYPGQNKILFVANSAWRKDPAFELWNANGATFYVDGTNGSSTADGLATTTGAKLTIQQAIDSALNDCDHVGLQINISIAAGTYTTGGSITGPPRGYTVNCNIVGDTGTPGNVIVNVAGGAICFFVRDLAIVSLSGMRLGSSGSASIGIAASQGSVVDFGTLEFNTMTGGQHISVDTSATASAVGNYAIIGVPSTHIFVQYGGTVDIADRTITIGSALAWGNACIDIRHGGNLKASGVIFTGAGVAGCTGKRFFYLNAHVNDASTTFPGNVAGDGYMNGADGLVGTPFYNFSNDLDNGMYRIGTNNFGFAAGGGKMLDINTVRVEIKGTNTNDAATAGTVGELIASSVTAGSAVSLTTTTQQNVTSISLTAGDWDVWFNPIFTGGGTTTVSYLEASLSVTSDTLSVAGGQYVSHAFGAATTPFATIDNGLSVGPFRVSVASTTTYYGVARAAFATSTCSVYGYLAARRCR